MVAVYPETITYPNNRYQIIFQRETRTDYQEAWEDDDSKTFFSNQRLDKILVKQSLDGITWNTVRQYDFIYSESAANQIYPGFTWTKGGYTSTLVGLQELDGGGTNALPATQFTYEDDLHVTAVNNGQGGEVEMTYERWTYLDDHNDDLRSLYTEFGVDECNWSVGTSWYEMPETNGSTSCYDNPGPLWVMGHNALGVALHTFPQHTIKPGGRYTLHISVSQRDNGSTGVFWGFTDPLNGKDVEWSTTVFGNTVQGFGGQVDMDVNFNPQETKCIIECDDCLVEKIQIMLMPLYYRVTQRVVTDNVSGDTSTYVYEYDEPAANDPSHSEAVLSDRPFWNSGHSYLYTSPYRQYRGNAVVHVKNPDDLVTTTWFYQNDILKGKAYQSLTYKEEFSENFDSGVLNTVDFNYSHEGTNQTIYIAEEGALKSENPNADWLTHVNRTGYEITNGKVVFGQFKLEDGVDSKTQLVASNGNYVGLESRASGAGQELLLSSQIGEDDLILLSNSEFKQDTWYGFMFLFNGICGTRVKVWEKANPQVSAEAVSTALDGQTALQFRQSVNHAVLWLDDYHEGYPYSETETRYAVDVLYDTIAGNAVPDISQSTLVSSYDDLQVTWSRVTESISRTFEGDTSWTGNKTVYDYNTGDQGGTQYGNLTRTTQYSGEFGTISVIHSGNLTSTTAYSGEYGTWTAYRGTKTQYFPDAANNLTAQPARQISLDCSSGSCDFSTENGLLSETLYLYDGAVSYFSEPANGILTAQRTWVQENNYAQVSYAYDSQGNLTDETVYTQYAGAASNPTGGAQTTHTEYDSINNTYATSVTNPLSQVTSMTYDYALGLPLSVTDANAATTIARYDPFGRMTSVIAPYDSVDSPTLQVIYQNYAGASSPYQVYLIQKVDGRNFIRISHFYDGLGREIQTQQADLPVYGALNNIVTDYDYDAVGNLVRTSIPRQISADTTPSMTGQDFTISSLTTYDVLGRPLSVEAPNKNTTTYAYDDLRTTVTNPRGFSTTSTYDIWGRVVAVDEAEGPDLSYIYDPLDRLLSVTSAGLTTTLAYDHAGRKTGMSDPDMGDWIYTYDALGTLLTQTDARGCQTSLSYDSLNRLTGKTYSGTLSECDNTPDVSYTYDGGTGNIGRRTGMTDGSGSTLWNYDQRGRLTSETKIIDGQSFTTSWTYNSADEVTSITYPDGEIVYNSYTHQGLLTAVSGSETYLKDMHYDAEGRISHIWLGSNVIEKHYTYYPWKNETVGGLLYSMDVQNANSENLLTLDYTYDKNANVTEISSSTAVETSSFTYDALDRLTSMTVNDSLTNVFTEAFGYDAANGNLLYKGKSSSNWAQYAYEGDQPHAVTSISGTQLEYGYDDNGNMVTRVEADGEERTLIYDAENNLVEVIAQQASPTPTPTEPALLNTDFQSPANTQAEAGGDADGFESSPENAFADDGTYALDTDSGTSSLADCADSGRDGQVYSDYSFGIPAGSAVSGIELRLDAFADDTGGNPQVCAQLSWDGGETWTDCKTTAVLTASEASYILGGQEDNWGHTWNTTQLAQGAFKVRLVTIAESDQRDFSLDWAAVKVYYLDGIALNLLDGANLKVLAGAAPLPESLRLQADEGTLTPTPTLTGTASPLPSETPQYTPTPSLTATETIVFTSTPTLTQTIETPLPSEPPEVSATPSPVVTEWTPTPTVTISGTPVETAALTPTPTASGTPTQTAVPTATLDPQVTDTGYLAVDAWSVSSNGDGDGYETDPANVYTDDSLFAADMNSGTAASLECSDTSRDMGIFTLTGGIDLSAAVLISGIEVRLDALASTDTMNAALCVQLSWDAGTSWSDCRETGALSTSETSYVLGGPQETWGVSQTLGLYNGDPIQVRIVNLASDTDTDFYLDWLAIKVYYLPETSTATSVPLNTPDGLMAIAASLTQINLSWHDNNSDETAFSLERSTDGGGSWQEIVVLDPDTTTYTDTGLTCGRVYDYRLRAYRAGDGLYSDYSAVESSPSGACTVQTDGEFEIHHMMTRTLGEFDDANPALVYSGTWTNESAAGAYNGTRTYSQNEGSKLTFTAEISCFSLLYTAMAGGADVDVYVDGDLFDTIDQNRSGLDYQEAWGSCGLESDQTHVLVFRQSSGALMDVDALLVKNNPLADDDDPLIHYDLGWSTYQGAGPYDDSIHYSETVGSRAEVTFSGSSVGLVYTKGSNRGVIKVEVDGVTLAYLNEHLTGTMYDAETQFQQSWTYNTLDVGEHILTLTHTSGTLVDIDGIRVAELLPAALEGASYVYDGDGNLVKSEVNGVVTYYLGKYYEKTVQNGHYAEKKHYSAGSTIIAVRTVIDGTQDTLNWLVGDHLGSTSLVTDSAGAVVNEVRYSAFGEMRYLNGETVTDLLYTGQKLEEELGLYYYVARWYDPYLNRFLSPDSIIPDPRRSTAYDRYAYVQNNPLKFSDPTGHMRTQEDAYYKGSTGNTSAAVTWKVIVETQRRIIEEKFPNVTLAGDFSYNELYTTTLALELTYRTHGGNIDSYTSAVGDFWIANIPYLGGMAPPYADTIFFPDQSYSDQNALFNLVHEIGHRFDFNNSGGNPKFYKSQTFVDVFAPGCDVGAMGCLGSNPRTIYKLYNVFSGGSGKTNYYTDSEYTTNYAVMNGSTEDFPESYANYVFNSQGLNSQIPGNRRVQDETRLFIIAVWVDLTK